jgi:hypothetical protein
MFVVTDEAVAAIRAPYQQHGELSASGVERDIGDFRSDAAKRPSPAPHGPLIPRLQALYRSPIRLDQMLVPHVVDFGLEF